MRWGCEASRRWRREGRSSRSSRMSKTRHFYSSHHRQSHQAKALECGLAKELHGAWTAPKSRDGLPFRGASFLSFDCQRSRRPANRGDVCTEPAVHARAALLRRRLARAAREGRRCASSGRPPPGVPRRVGCSRACAPYRGVRPRAPEAAPGPSRGSARPSAGPEAGRIARVTVVPFTHADTDRRAAAPGRSGVW